MSYKLCPKCNENKEKELFSKALFSMKIGWCKACFKKYRKEWKINQSALDPSFLLRKNISSFISKRLQKGKDFKKGDPIINCLPYTIKQLEQHFEDEFISPQNMVDGKSWMGWHSYGKYNKKNWDDEDMSTWTWQLDHIISHDSFKYLSVNDDAFKKCWTLDNLKASPAKKNFREQVTKSKLFNIQYNLDFPHDYYNQILCGDSLNIMKNIPSESIDLVVTSPPYNLGIRKTFSTAKNWKGKWNNSKLQNEGYDFYSDYMPEEKYCAWQKNILSECMRLIKEDGAVFYNHKWRVQDGLFQQRASIIEGLPLRQIIIWKKSGGMNFNDSYFLPTYEVIYLFAKPKFKLANKSNLMTDVWEIPQEKGSWHPAPFPLEIALRCVKSTSGSIILDPFMGSGTVGLASKQLNKTYIGIDISEVYCNKAKERIDYSSKSSI